MPGERRRSRCSWCKRLFQYGKDGVTHRLQSTFPGHDAIEKPTLCSTQCLIDMVTHWRDIGYTRDETVLIDPIVVTGVDDAAVDGLLKDLGARRIILSCRPRLLGRKVTALEFDEMGIDTALAEWQPPYSLLIPRPQTYLEVIGIHRETRQLKVIMSSADQKRHGTRIIQLAGEE